MVNLLNAIDGHQAEYLLIMLERIQDDVTDIRKIFEERVPGAYEIKYWIAILRIIRFSQIIKKEISNYYDEFVNAYQALRIKNNKSENEKKLEKEIGELLYKIDEIFGDYDRLISRLMKQMNKKLVDVYGMQLEPDESFYSGEIDRANSEEIYSILEGLIELSMELMKYSKITLSLLRMKKLILTE